LSPLGRVYRIIPTFSIRSGSAARLLCQVCEAASLGFPPLHASQPFSTEPNGW
jgi:hypothetical protein